MFGIEPWDEGSSHTLSTIFSCWDAGRLALVYTRSGLPYTDVASRFFQISENLVLHGLLKPWVTVGKEVGCARVVDESLVRAERARYERAHKRHSTLMALCREVVWLLGHWRGHALDRFVKDFDPDVLFVPIYPMVYMSWVERRVIRRSGKPFVCYLTDDNYSYRSCSNPLKYLHRFWLRRNVRWLSTHCRRMFVIVNKEKEETDALFGTDSVILTKSVDFSDRPFSPRPVGSPIKMVYTGNLFYGRDKSLALVAEALEELNIGVVRAELDIYSQYTPADTVLARLNRGASRFCGSIPRSEVDRVQREADVVVFAEGLEGKEANIARLSFSTKITDYLANGKCVLAVGKDEIAPIDYLRRNDAAIVATDAGQIKVQLRRIVDDPSLISGYSRRAYDCAVRNHEKSAVDSRFIAAMQETAR